MCHSDTVHRAAAVFPCGDRPDRFPIRTRFFRRLRYCTHILIYADLGSSILSAETAIDLIDEDLAEKVQLVDAPIVEGALAGVVQGTISDDVADVIKASEDARNVHKN